MHRLRGFSYTWRKFTGMARVRAFYWRHIRNEDGEICQSCGRPVRVVWWCHDDRLWALATGKSKVPGSAEAAGGISCIPCFTEAAREHVAWLEWAPVNLQFLTADAPKEQADE
jgi:hypothetical protein